MGHPISLGLRETVGESLGQAQVSHIRAADPAVRFEGGNDRGDNFGAGFGADRGVDRQRKFELESVDCTLDLHIEVDRVGAAGHA